MVKAGAATVDTARLELPCFQDFARKPLIPRDHFVISL
jgi:hypothetical protein